MTVGSCEPFHGLFVEPFDRGRNQWFVLRTKSRQEKVLASELRARSVPHFLPLVSVARSYGGRKAVVEIPLFPGYLFLRGGRDDAYDADRTKRVAQIIDVADQVLLHDELRNIALALGRNATLDLYPYLREGVRVEVRAGPLRGLRGVVEDRNHRDRVILNVDILGSAVSVEVDASLVELLD